MMEASTGVVPNQLQNPAVMTTGPDYYYYYYYYDAGGRGASEISRELRCPVRYDQNHCV
jgi:hypothetical protein